MTEVKKYHSCTPGPFSGTTLDCHTPLGTQNIDDYRSRLKVNILGETSMSQAYEKIDFDGENPRDYIQGSLTNLQLGLDEEEIGLLTEKLYNSIVLIWAQGSGSAGFGTGFYFSGSHISTNSHVSNFDDPSNYISLFQKGELYSLGVVNLTGDTIGINTLDQTAKAEEDIAILNVSSIPQDQTLTLGTDTDSNHTLISAGFETIDGKIRLIIRKSKKLGFFGSNSDFMTSSTKQNKGNSGGPIFTINGKVCGMVTGRISGNNISEKAADIQSIAGLAGVNNHLGILELVYKFKEENIGIKLNLPNFSEDINWGKIVSELNTLLSVNPELLRGINSISIGKQRNTSYNPSYQEDYNRNRINIGNSVDVFSGLSEKEADKLILYAGEDSKYLSKYKTQNGDYTVHSIYTDDLHKLHSNAYKNFAYKSDVYIHLRDYELIKYLKVVQSKKEDAQKQYKDFVNIEVDRVKNETIPNMLKKFDERPWYEMLVD